MLGTSCVFFVVCFFAVFDFVSEGAGFFLELAELGFEAVLLYLEVFFERLGLEDEQLVLLLEVVFLVLRASDFFLRGGRARQGADGPGHEGLGQLDVLRDVAAAGDGPETAVGGRLGLCEVVFDVALAAAFGGLFVFRCFLRAVDALRAAVHSAELQLLVFGVDDVFDVGPALLGVGAFLAFVVWLLRGEGFELGFGRGGFLRLLEVHVGRRVELGLGVLVREGLDLQLQADDLFLVPALHLADAYLQLLLRLGQALVARLQLGLLAAQLLELGPELLGHRRPVHARTERCLGLMQQTGPGQLEFVQEVAVGLLEVRDFFLQTALVELLALQAG